MTFKELFLEEIDRKCDIVALMSRTFKTFGFKKTDGSCKGDYIAFINPKMGSKFVFDFDDVRFKALLYYQEDGAESALYDLDNPEPVPPNMISVLKKLVNIKNGKILKDSQTDFQADISDYIYGK